MYRKAPNGVELFLLTGNVYQFSAPQDYLNEMWVITMIRRRISKEALEGSAYEEWNAFIDLIAMEDYKDLNHVQRIAHLCFWYDSEVQNGGHIQYFENKGTAKIDETIIALKSLGAMKQADILSQVYEKYSSKVRKKLYNKLTFIIESRKGEYERFDNQYYASEPTVTELLENYLAMHKLDFILVM